MNEIEQRLEEIRARVAATTKDDWSACGYPREGLIPAYWAVMSGGAVVAIARPGFGRPGEDEANAWFIAWAKPDLEFLMDRIARLTAELRATKTALEDTRADRARVGLETRKAAQQESAAEVERLQREVTRRDRVIQVAEELQEWHRQYARGRGQGMAARLRGAVEDEAPAGPDGWADGWRRGWVEMDHCQRAKKAEAEVERLRAIIDAIVTGPGVDEETLEQIRPAIIHVVEHPAGPTILRHVINQGQRVQRAEAKVEQLQRELQGHAVPVDGTPLEQAAARARNILRIVSPGTVRYGRDVLDEALEALEAGAPNGD